MIQHFAVSQLRRELGRWDLTAIGINQVIGGAVFAMPAALAALVGGWSPFLIVARRVRVDADRAHLRAKSAAASTRPAVPTSTRKRRVRPLSRVRSRLDAVVHARRELGVRDQRPGRVARLLLARRDRRARRARSLLTAIIAALAFINVLGIRQSAWVVNALTIGKLVPLALFIVVGLTAVDVGGFELARRCRR